MRVLLIDNYDSFTWNLVHLLARHGAEVEVVRNDALSVAEAMAHPAEAIVLSPGPCGPEEAGVCVPLVRALNGAKPVFGVCLGFQAIGVAYGARLVRAPAPMHGKVSPVRHDGAGVLRGAPSPLPAARYHSLALDAASFPADLAATAWTDDGLPMALSHRRHPVHGVLFHPESIATPDGGVIAAAFLDLARAARQDPCPAAA